MASKAICTVNPYTSESMTYTDDLLYLPQLPQSLCGSFGSPQSWQIERAGVVNA
jgi:hypothetical protein